MMHAKVSSYQSTYVQHFNTRWSNIIFHAATQPDFQQLLLLNIEGEQVKIIRRVSTDWINVATFLGFDRYEIEILERDNPRDTEGACRKMFMKWLDSKDATWEKLIKALYDAERSELAKKVEKWLTVNNKFSSS